MQSKNTLWLLVVIAVIIIAALAVWAFKPKGDGQNTPQGNEEQQPDGAIQKTVVEPSQLPSIMPSDLPFEANAKIIENYTAPAGLGKQQATRTYQTSKALVEVLTPYEEYFADKAWKIDDTVDQPRTKAVVAIKDGVRVSVTVSQNDVTGDRIVGVTATELP